MWWIAIIVVAIAAYQYAKPKPIEPQKPHSQEPPSAEEGKALRVLFGTRTTKQYNTTHFLDTGTEAIRRKV